MADDDRSAHGAAGPTLADPKALIALRRAVPKTRMRDYGMSAADAAALGGLGDGDASWSAAAEGLAEAHLRAADDFAARGMPVVAAAECELAASVFNVAQLEFNDDRPRKVALYERAVAALEAAARTPGSDIVRRNLVADGVGQLYGWEIPVVRPAGYVLIVGGLSGWGASFLRMARAFARRRIGVLLVEGPGQGLTRMRSGIPLSRATLAAFRPYLDHAASLTPDVAIVGNSFGGLIAAHLAASDARIGAACINGAAPDVVVPEFRMAKEQMAAAFGASGRALDERVAGFRFSPRETPICCPLLIIEGGADPLVARGVQRNFLSDPPVPGSLVRTWPDGEHTIYNHADERDAFISAWVLDRFISNGRSRDERTV